MQKPSQIETFLRFQTNSSQAYSSCSVGFQQISPQKQQYLTITFHLTLFECLNYAIKKQANVIRLWINNYWVLVKVVTKRDKFNLEEMNYLMFVDYQTNLDANYVSLAIDNVKEEPRNSSFEVRIGIFRELLGEINTICFEIGSKNNHQIVKNLIENLCFSFKSQKEQEKSSLESIKFIDRQFSLPLTLFLGLQDVKNCFKMLKKTNLSQSYQSMIDNLPIYTPKITSKTNKIYFCHDMKNGYKEDLNFSNSYQCSQKKQCLSFRCFHLEQSQVFNYFSHHNITIPPLHWRVLCQRFGVRCLGTFIVESGEVDEDVYLSEEFAFLLIYVARKCRFDGYLINQQYKIRNVSKLIKWLQFLTQKSHQLIPNSKIIWYDSISVETGQISYQNQLNSNNIKFCNATDGFFSNYWWNQQSLENSKVNSIQTPNKSIYVGNDCFGRNTYGGGKFDIYKAASVLLKNRPELKISMFAPGFTYQDGGEDNRQKYINNQNRMYKGFVSKTYEIENDWWKVSKNGGNGWKQEGDWTVASHQLCERYYGVPLKDFYFANTKMKVYFEGQVVGTAPKFQDPYKIIVQIVDQLSNTIFLETEAYSTNNMDKADQKCQMVRKELEFESQLLTISDNIAVRVIQMGKDAENWAGNYGARFRGETLVISCYQKDKNWTEKVGVEDVTIGDQAIHSFNNTGFGDYFYFNGSKVQERYDFLGDMDVSHTHIINGPLSCEFFFEDAFIGGSCFKINDKQAKLMRLKIQEKTDLSEKYYLFLTTKGAGKVQAQMKYISQDEKDRIFIPELQGSKEINGWVRHTYLLKTKVSQVMKTTRTRLDLTVQNSPFLLGEIKIVKQRLRKNQELNGCIEISKEILSLENCYVNIKVKSQNFNRLLLAIEGNYSGFLYFSEGQASLTNICIKRQTSYKITIFQVDNYTEDLKVLQRIINQKQLTEMILKGVLLL